jgi:hypothetical protein
MPEGRMGHPFRYFLTKATVAPLSVILVLWVPAAVNQVLARTRLGRIDIQRSQSMTAARWMKARK